MPVDPTTSREPAGGLMILVPGAIADALIISPYLQEFRLVCVVSGFVEIAPRCIVCLFRMYLLHVNCAKPVASIMGWDWDRDASPRLVLVKDCGSRCGAEL